MRARDYLQLCYEVKQLAVFVNLFASIYIGVANQSIIGSVPINPREVVYRVVEDLLMGI